MNTDNPFNPPKQEPIMGKVETVQRYVDFHKQLKDCQRVEWRISPTPPRISLTIGNEVYQMPQEVLWKMFDVYLEHQIKMQGGSMPIIQNTEQGK
jgi:hypothetical protein